jgi:hypothetical protein
LTPMADWPLHYMYMTNVMVLTLQLSTVLFYEVTYHIHLLVACMYVSQLIRYARSWNDKNNDQ